MLVIEAVVMLFYRLAHGAYINFDHLRQMAIYGEVHTTHRLPFELAEAGVLYVEVVDSFNLESDSFTVLKFIGPDLDCEEFHDLVVAGRYDVIWQNNINQAGMKECFLKQEWFKEILKTPQGTKIPQCVYVSCFYRWHGSHGVTHNAFLKYQFVTSREKGASTALISDQRFGKSRCHPCLTRGDYVVVLNPAG